MSHLSSKLYPELCTLKRLYFFLALITPHTQREQGRVIVVGVHIYNVYMCTCTVCRPDNKQNSCGLRKNANVRSSALKEVRH